ncbi:hypothetical protein C475_03399 [Halosimplex carlsbadense 2-9-1]|uniref:DUF7978 domain-containing protein n=1 Tax=Halosimplex carlsbadense 2-9-1 TaxID=797114 RepID=M0D1B2_9EURY|nr:hypothetical protein [Halosimplex carlsbadense]ELZ29230.1 hypothetical protein C475_03399 [Halosimplex carlsbadense 2-9-1]
MTSDRTDESTGGERSGDRTVSVRGTEVVLEGAFVSFPWRAGMARAPSAFLAAFVLTGAVAAIGGFGSGSLQRRFALLGIAVFNAHNIPATTGAVPQLLAPVADPVVAVPGIGRLLRGLFTFGTGHAAPVSHVSGIVSGQTAEIGHLNLLTQLGETGVSVVVYYLLAPVALVGAGYEFADSHWADTTTESFAGVARFGLAIAAGYVLVLLVGSVLFTAVSVGGVTILPDRYLLVVYGFAYPTIFATLGAWLVYRDRT